MKYHRRDRKIGKNQKKEHSLNPNLTRRIFVMNWKIKTKEKIVRIDDFDEHFMNPKRALNVQLKLFVFVMHRGHFSFNSVAWSVPIRLFYCEKLIGIYFYRVFKRLLVLIFIFLIRTSMHSILQSPKSVENIKYVIKFITRSWC